MDLEGRARGIAVPIVLVAWVVAVSSALIGSTEPENGAVLESPTPLETALSIEDPVTSPVRLPTTVLVGTELDAESNQVAEQQLRFSSGSTIAFSAWLGMAVGYDHVLFALVRLQPDGFEWLGSPQPISVDPLQAYVAGKLDADDILELVGPGTYLLDLRFPSAERIGYAPFQLQTDIPEDIEFFAQGWRQVTIAEGAHIGVRFGSDGERVAEKPAALARQSQAAANHRAVFGGQPYLFIVDGIWRNYYLRESDSVRLSDR